MGETSVGLISIHDINAAYERVWGTVSLYQGTKATRAITGTASIVSDVWKARAIKYMHANLDGVIRDVWTESRTQYIEALQDAILTARNEGLGVEATQRRIRKLVNDKLGGDINIWRARRIAQTEMIRAGNYGTWEAYNDIEANTGVKIYKVWNVRGGAKHPRHETYAGLDGQRREKEKPFDVGGYPLMFPGDPKGPAHETINCYCFMTAMTEKDLLAEGNFI